MQSEGSWEVPCRSEVSSVCLGVVPAEASDVRCDVMFPFIVTALTRTPRASSRSQTRVPAVQSEPAGGSGCVDSRPNPASSPLRHNIYLYLYTHLYY